MLAGDELVILRIAFNHGTQKRIIYPLEGPILCGRVVYAALRAPLVSDTARMVRYSNL